MGLTYGKKIALVQLPHFFGEGYSRPPECYPLGLGYLSSVLNLQGISHEGVDLWGSQFSEDQAIEKIDFERYDVIGISSYSTQYRYLKNFSKKVKELYPEKPIICGGPGPTFSYEMILKNTGVDVCILGEGEETLIDLLQNYGSLGAVKGIAYRENGKIVVTDSRQPIKDLDALPLPNRELFDLEKIIEVAARVKDQSRRADGCWELRRSADIIAGRGCPYNCNYCSKTFEGLRLRSVDGIMSEIEELIRKYRIDHIQFNDELVLINRKRTLQLCTELGRLGIAWSCQGRINQVDREILHAMKKAGCVEIGYGVESVSQTILDAMNKRINAADIVPVVKMTRDVGIRPVIQYMYGYPGEDDATIDATVRFFREIDHPYVSFTTTPLPGTALYRDCRRDGAILDEEDYLMKLDSGYNMDRPLVNLTKFSDEEFVQRKRKMQMRITHNYLVRRPLDYARFLCGYVVKRARRLF